MASRKKSSIILSQISDAVVERLKGEMSAQEQQRQQQQQKQQQQQQQQQQQHQERQQPGHPPAYFAPPAPPQAMPVLPPAPPPAIEMPPPAQQTSRGPEQQGDDTRPLAEPGSLTALRVRAEKEEELRLVEGYWQDRVKKLREHVKAMRLSLFLNLFLQQLSRENVAEETFRDTVNEVEKLFPKVKGQPICQNDRHMVLK